MVACCRGVNYNITNSFYYTKELFPTPTLFNVFPRSIFLFEYNFANTFCRSNSLSRRASLKIPSSRLYLSMCSQFLKGGIPIENSGLFLCYRTVRPACWQWSTRVPRSSAGIPLGGSPRTGWKRSSRQQEIPYHPAPFAAGCAKRRGA